jgi:hypothetical protein
MKEKQYDISEIPNAWDGETIPVVGTPFIASYFRKDSPNWKPNMQKYESIKLNYKEINKETLDYNCLVTIVKNFSNKELIDVIKEICNLNNTELSNNSDKLFKLWNNDYWTIGSDRYNDVYQCLELEIMYRIKLDLIKLN